MARRVYTDVSDSYAPFRNAVLQGLGAATPLAVKGKLNSEGWPVGRSYVGTAHFRAPYDEFGYFQDGTLNGLGQIPMQNSPTRDAYSAMAGLGAVAAAETAQVAQLAPGAVKQFILSGDPVSPLRGNVTLPFNQVHPYVYGGLALAALATSYVTYKKWKKTQPGGNKAQ